MRLGRDYIYRDDLFDPKSDGTTVPIQLMVDKFSGVVYRYCTIKFSVSQMDQVPSITFEYDILESDELSKAPLRASDHFNYVLGEVLDSILNDLDRGTNESGTNNSEKFDNQGGLH